MTIRPRQTIAGFLILTGLLAGCIDLPKGTQRPTRLYMLTATAAAASGPILETEDDLSVGIGPLAFPEYLDRTQIITRTGRHELKGAPFANWAEPLKENVMGVLVDNLAALTGSDAVYSYPWRMDQAPQVQLQLAIDRFDAERGGEAVLAARWEWLDRSGSPLMRRERTVLSLPVEGEGDDAVVAAMSRLLEDFGRTVVARLDRILT